MNRTNRMLLGATVLATFAITVSLLRPATSSDTVSSDTVSGSRKIPDFAVKSIQGSVVHLSSPQGVKATVIAFTGLTCPVSKRYGPSLARIEDTYAPKGVRFLFVNPAKNETEADMKSAVVKLGLNGSYIHDAQGTVAKLLEAKSTTEVFVLDSRQNLIYRGAVDDQYGIGFSKPAPKSSYLKDALNAVIRGETPRIARTSASGCVLEASDAPKPTVPETYHNRVSDIVKKNCQTCHRTGGVAPFDLESYAAVKGRAKMIQYVVENKLMPPWFAEPANKTLWQNDRSLDPADKKALLNWISNGTPKGDGTEATHAKPTASDWLIGKPDAVFALPKPVKVKAEGTMPYQNVVVPVNFPTERWIQAMEVKPTAKQVVHHILVFVTPKMDGANRLARLREAIDERSGFFAIYVPGNSTLQYPDGFAKRIPAGTDLRFQIHYTPNGTAIEDQSEIGLVFAKTPPKHEVKTVGIANLRISIPPGAENHREVAQLTVPDNVQVLSYLPHMHLRGKACRYELFAPDGTKETLLDIPRYDFNWQLQYTYRQPKPIAKGSRIEFAVWYDNSSKNRANPDPNRSVRWGSQTSDEMHLGYVEYFVPGAKPGEETTSFRRRLLGQSPTRNNGVGQRIEQVFRRLDRNRDGVLMQEEVGAFWNRLKKADTDGDGKVTLNEAKTSFSGNPSN